MRYLVTDVSPFNDSGLQIVTVERTETSRWFRRVSTHENKYLTTYGHVWNHYPDGSRVGGELECELGDAFDAYEAREAIAKEME